MLLYGPSGNGKTAITEALRQLIPGTIAIPHAIEFRGIIIQMFDVAFHEPVTLPADEAQYDQRWVHCRRPMISTGRELTIDACQLVLNRRTGIFRAPLQTMGNGGLIVIDDLGRQQCRADELLNWWLPLLDVAIDRLTLDSGERAEVPFFATVVFATNQPLPAIADDAFLRRIPYKVSVRPPDRAQFVQMFARHCDKVDVPYDPAIAEHLLASLDVRGIAPRACHPRDVVNQALALAAYRGLPRQLTVDLLDRACASYFVHEPPAVSASV